VPVLLAQSKKPKNFIKPTSHEEPPELTEAEQGLLAEIKESYNRNHYTESYKQPLRNESFRDRDFITDLDARRTTFLGENYANGGLRTWPSYYWNCEMYKMVSSLLCERIGFELYDC
jgi:hypothetical protein